MYNSRKITALLLTLVLLAGLFAGCAAPAAAPSGTPAPAARFTDSAGRALEVPAEITRIAVTGPMAQTVLFALAPDMLVGIAVPFADSAPNFLDSKYLKLPVLGQLYGGKGEMNLEALLAAGPQLVIDVGETTGATGPDLDALSKQTGIPFVHLAASTADMGETYRALGELLGLKSEAETLAAYCDEIYGEMKALSESVDKAKILYCLGDKGINVIAADSYHSEALDLLAENLAVLDSPSAKGTGNEVDMETILGWDPEVIIFAPQSVYETAGRDAAWQKLKAISGGSYYEVPYGMHNWMGFPPSVQRYMGMLWLAKILYPEAADYDLYTEIARYYGLFYHCGLTREQFDAITANSLG